MKVLITIAKIHYSLVSLRMKTPSQVPILNLILGLGLEQIDPLFHTSLVRDDLTSTISSSSAATLGRFSLERTRILAFVILLISVIIDPPFPIRQPIREVCTSKRVVKEIRPESLSTFSLHLGCKRMAASIAGDIVSS